MSATYACTVCGVTIQEATSRRHGGLCAYCVQLSAAQIKVRRLVASGLDPFKHAVRLYTAAIEKVSWEQRGGFFGATGDPALEALRLYRFETLEGCFQYDEASELAAAESDEIEYFLSEAKFQGSLFGPILRVLQNVAPRVNSQGGTVFLGSWGMGPAEIGWSIRYLNERRFFVRYLQCAGVSEEEVARYDAGFMDDLNDESQA